MRKRPNQNRLAVVLVAAVMTLANSTGAQEDPSEITIGLIPEMNVFEQMDRFRPLSEYLSLRLGRKVNLTMLSRYGNIVERIEKKEVDAAFLGSFTGALASAQLGMIPVARPINLDDSSTYWGYLFVRKESGIRTPEEMKGLRLALVERATTAGFVFPMAFLRGHGVDIDGGFFSEVQFWGSHDATIMAVLDGRADIGAAKNTIWELMVQKNPDLDERLQILAVSPKVPSNGLLVSPTLSAEIREEIRSLLLDLENHQDAKPILENLRFKGFVPTDRESYAPVFGLARDAGIDMTSYDYRNE